eukprot:m.196378 g.196378  ORF g.196378 m.196378 type:complete len:1530 (+) comp16817_c1_seq1:88-4677(+)
MLKMRTSIACGLLCLAAAVVLTVADNNVVQLSIEDGTDGLPNFKIDASSGPTPPVLRAESDQLQLSFGNTYTFTVVGNTSLVLVSDYLDPETLVVATGIAGQRTSTITIPALVRLAGTYLKTTSSDMPFAQLVIDGASLDCQYEAWLPCSLDNGRCIRKRFRSGEAPADCDLDFVQIEPCAASDCQCAVSEWSAWSDCSMTCGAGTMSRTRTIVGQGASCPPLSESAPCNVQPCPDPSIELVNGTLRFVGVANNDFDFAFGDGHVIRLRERFSNMVEYVDNRFEGLEQGELASTVELVETLSTALSQVEHQQVAAQQDRQSLESAISSVEAHAASETALVQSELSSYTREVSASVDSLATSVDEQLGALTQLAIDIDTLDDKHQAHNDSLVAIFEDLLIVENYLGAQGEKIAGLTATLDKTADCVAKGQMYSAHTDACVDIGKIPTDEASCASPNDVGRLWFNVMEGAVFICDGTDWIPLHSSQIGTSANKPASSCQEIYRRGENHQDGLYYVRTSAGVGKQYCLMSRDGFSVGGNGATRDSPALSCASLMRFFDKTSAHAGLYWINPGLNDEDDSPLNTIVQQYCVFDGEFSGDGRSFENPAKSCSSILAFYPEFGPYSDGAFYITTSVHGVQRIWCDMTTEGGGWTLMLKFLGKDSTLNSRNTANFREGKLLGTTELMSEENAVGPAYASTPFTDVMIISVNPLKKERRLGWRHPTTFSSLKSVINRCQPVDTGVRMFGAVHNLDYPGAPYNSYYVACTTVKYGMLLQDYDTYKYFAPFGCSNLNTGHSIGVLGAAITPTGDRSYNDQNEQDITHCVTNFGVAAGYYRHETTDDSYSINAHWWGAGNDQTWNWNSHAVMVREYKVQTRGGDGSSPAAAGLSCAFIKQQFGVTTSGLRWIYASETPGPNQAMPVYCDMSGDGVSWGSDGSSESRWSRSCAHIKTYFPHLAEDSKTYYVWDTRYGEARETFCDMKTVGGGWTLATKVRGRDGTLNIRNTRNWREGVYIDWMNSMSDVNALGGGFNSVPFSDVLIRSLRQPRRALSWRHTRTFPSLHFVVTNCIKDATNNVLYGSVQNLDYPGSNAATFYAYTQCSTVRYGTFLNDWTYSYFPPAGCTNLLNGHGVGIVGTAIPETTSRNYGPDDGITTRCNSNFAVGGGYTSVSSGDDVYAINSHWWGAGNDYTNNFNSMAIMLRPNLPLASVSAFHGFGDGSSAAQAGISCAHLLAEFRQQTSGLYWVRKVSAAHPVQVYCQYLNGVMIDHGGDGSTPASAGRDCKTIKDYFQATGRRAFWIFDESTDEDHVFEVFCDQDTGGGGWTLVAKVRGNDATMNSRQWQYWRDNVLIGSTADMTDHNALGKGYSGVRFRDIMIQSVNNPARNMAWRHGKEYSSLGDVVQACTPVDDGQLLYGRIENLDSPWIANPRYNSCSRLRYGILLADYTYTYFGPAGCGQLPTGHSVGIVGAATPIDASHGPADTGASYYCITNFGIGSGYTDVVSGDDTFAINAHWWGNGNTDTYNWRSHAILVRGI